MKMYCSPGFSYHFRLSENRRRGAAMEAKLLLRRRVVILGLIFLMLASGRAPAKELALLNVSYDATREFYQDYNQVFAEYWRRKTGDMVRVNLSNGGSAKQA